MPKCPFPGCNKSAILKRNLRCNSCDGSRHAPRMGASFGNSYSGQNAAQSHNDTSLSLALSSMQTEVHTSSPPVQHIHSCDSSEQSSTGYSTGGYSGGCSTDNYNGGGGDFGGGGSGSEY